MRAEEHVSDAKHSTGAPPNQLPLGTGDQESPRALRCDLDTVCTRRPGGDLLPILTYGRHVPTPRVAVSVGLLRPFFRPTGYDHSTLSTFLVVPASLIAAYHIMRRHP